MNADVDGTTLYHETLREGEPAIVCLHGGLGLDHTYLRPCLDPLADAARLVVPGPARQRAFFGCLPDFSALDRLGEIDAPALVLAGRHDWITPPGPGAERLHAGLPESELVIFEDSAHFPFMEEPPAFLDVVGRMARPALLTGSTLREAATDVPTTLSMTVTLTRADERRLTDAASALVTPLDHATFEEWAEPVYRRVKAVVGADTGGLELPSAERHHFVAPEGEPGVISAYREIWPLYAKRFRLAERAVELGVHNRAMLYHPYGEEMFNGPYYHDFVVPYRCFDAICMSTGPTRDGFWAGVLLHHESATGPRFGERGLALLRLLHPAFCAGVATWLRLSRIAPRLARLLDKLADAVLVFDRAGRLVHRNPAAARLLAACARAARPTGWPLLPDRARRCLAHRNAPFAARSRPVGVGPWAWRRCRPRPRGCTSPRAGAPSARAKFREDRC